MGRPAKLSPTAAAELRQRWALYEQNRPAVLERDYGMGRDALRNYLRDRVKKRRAAP